MKEHKDWICRYYSEHEDGEPDGEIIQELIRCKDCKHRDEETANCIRFRKDWYVQSNSFCSWAEPKVTS